MTIDIAYKYYCIQNLALPKPTRNFAININYQCFLCILIAYNLFTSVFNSLKSFKHILGFFYNESSLYKVTNIYLIIKFDSIIDFHTYKYKVVIIIFITFSHKVVDQYNIKRFIGVLSD